MTGATDYLPTGKPTLRGLADAAEDCHGCDLIHKQPGRTEIVACSAWLEAELRVVRPSVVVCLGAIAAKAILGSPFTVTEQRGVVIERPDYDVVATVHPASVLRAPDRHPAYEAFVADLRGVAGLLAPDSPR